MRLSQVRRRSLTPAAIIAVTFVASGVATAHTLPRASIRSVTLASDMRSVWLRLSNGHSKLFVADQVDAFDGPRLSADHRRAGWSELSHVTGSYLTPASITVYVDARLRHFACDGGVPEKWWFTGQHYIVLQCAYPHGPRPPWSQRFDTTTGRTDGRRKPI